MNLELQAELCTLLEAGNTMVCAARCCHVPVSSIMDWMARGRNNESPFSGFLEAVEAAQGRAEEEAVAALTASYKGKHDGDWKAAESWLKRRNHKDWGDKQDVVVGKPEPEMDLTRLSSRKLLAYYEAKRDAATTDEARAEFALHVQTVKGLIGG